MSMRTERNRSHEMKSGKPCFALFVGLLLWGMRNAETPAGEPRHG
ncbi:hypothetical protein ACFQ1E_04105 [Sphingomonas canadensis]|uniref:Uncharacterized protein n=1 Tax=Sphingomonas canadensis TaxID=1219257 RepID=A0ABW3H7U0_9SPHN|nr:hypothetical protein [Sphingomonas canadensis]MCW3834573.1 hypothetical protein [Sphingomonas canadensis]